MLAFHAQKGREEGRRHARADLDGTARFGTVADHAGEVGNHVLHRMAYPCVVATHEIDDAAARPDTGNDTSAQGRELAEALLDIDGGEV